MNDWNGGAARAAYRLHRGLIEAGLASRMLVRDKVTSDSTVIRARNPFEKLRSDLDIKLDKLPRAFYPNRSVSTPWSLNWLPNNIVTQINSLQPDIVHLHWIGYGYVPIEAIKRIQVPIVWTMHDMWAFTGGCHYDEGCGKFQSGCGACPQLASNRSYDLSKWIWRRKQVAWARKSITLVAPSRWMEICVRSTEIFSETQILHIPNGIDVAAFRPIDKVKARQALSLPLDRQIVLFGAELSTRDTRKGFQYLQAALRQLVAEDRSNQPVEFVIFGADRPTERSDSSIAAHYVGTISDEARLAQLYSAADVFIAPSIQDNLPNTVLEALACGTPVVAFDIGGMADMIEHKQNGYLAKPLDSSSLADGIAWILDDPKRWNALSDHARDKIMQEFTIELQVRRYQALYNELTQARSDRQ